MNAVRRATARPPPLVGPRRSRSSAASVSRTATRAVCAATRPASTVAAASPRSACDAWAGGFRSRAARAMAWIAPRCAGAGRARPGPRDRDTGECKAPWPLVRLCLSESVFAASSERCLCYDTVGARHTMVRSETIALMTLCTHACACDCALAHMIVVDGSRPDGSQHRD